jgi:phosphotransferase system enzyme I (PtsP)
MKVRVHERGDRRLDGILRLIEEAGRARPLGEVLAELCRQIAEIGRADVASVYVLEVDAEGREVLVLRGNLGFPDGCVGAVRLRVGEGLTGFVAECLRPVSLAVGRHDPRYKRVEGLDEESFPSYLGVPLLGGGGALGVLVLQRREPRALPPAEVALAASLGAPVAFALERARGRAEERAVERGAMPGPTRAARLDGRALGGGAALGRIDVLPSLDAEAQPRAGTPPGHAVALALAALSRELGRAETVAAARAEAQVVQRMRALTVLLEDLRLRDLAVAACGELGVARGLASVAREYARAQYRVPGTADWLAERATEVEDLCLLVGARVAGRPLPANGAVVVAERLTGILALAAVAHRAVGVVISGSGDESAFGAAIARAAGLAVVAEVSGLYAWARPDDRALVDGDAGSLRINPPATVVAKFRARSG